MKRLLRVEFVDFVNPQLWTVEFFNPIEKCSRLSVRGKTAGGYPRSVASFQWTSAVQGISLLFIRGVLASHPDRPTNVAPLPRESVLQGGKGSIVASVDYALDKQPEWLMEMFGTSTDGRSYAKSFIRRTNPGMKRAGPVCIGLYGDLLLPGAIQITWENEEITNYRRLLEFYRALERSCGALDLVEVATSVSDTSQDPSISNTVVPPVLSSNGTRFKTPFVKQPTSSGDVYCRVYEQNGEIALVTCFSPPDKLRVGESIPVRLHSSCIPSVVLKTLDCDCQSQLENALQVLRTRGGILVYLFQEGRGAGLISKYLGISLMDQLGVDTFEAYARLSLPPDSRGYEIAATALHDLGIKKVDLLTNNPSKVSEMSSHGFHVTRQNCFGTVTPQNLSYLFDKVKVKHHEMQALFEDDTAGFHLIRRSDIGGGGKRVWIFGGDDTIWEDNIVYEDIIRQYIDYICQWVPTASRSKVRSVIDEVEAEVVPTQGFGAPGFLRSLREAFNRILKLFEVSVEPPEDLLSTVIPRLSKIASEIPRGTIEALERLSESGDRLVLFTQGPLFYQLLKIAQSRLGRLFHAICVVSNKSPSTLERLLKEMSIRVQDSLVVGSSLKFDIEPAKTLGVAAIHYRNPLSWHLFDRHDLFPEGVREIYCLSELLTNLEPTDHKEK